MMKYREINWNACLLK
jgi:RNA-directed DNA polymerase